MLFPMDESADRLETIRMHARGVVAVLGVQHWLWDAIGDYHSNYSWT